MGITRTPKHELVRTDAQFISFDEYVDKAAPDGKNIARAIHMGTNSHIEGLNRSGFYTSNFDGWEIMAHSIIQVPGGIVSTLTLRLYSW